MVNLNAIIEDRVVIKTKGVTRLLKIDEISHVLADTSTSAFYLLGHSDPIYVSRILKNFESNLLKRGFIKINRGTIVNFCKICQIVHKSGIHYLIMDDGRSLPISLRHYGEIMELLKNNI